MYRVANVTIQSPPLVETPWKMFDSPLFGTNLFAHKMAVPPDLQVLLGFTNLTPDTSRLVLDYSGSLKDVDPLLLASVVPYRVHYFGRSYTKSYQDDYSSNLSFLSCSSPAQLLAVCKEIVLAELQKIEKMSILSPTTGCFEPVTATDVNFEPESRQHRDDWVALK